MSSDKNSFGMHFDPAQWNELVKVLEELPANVGQNAMVAALKNGGERIQKSAQSVLASSRQKPPRAKGSRTKISKLIASETGLSTSLLSKSIKVRAVKKYQPNFFKVTIGVKINRSGTRQSESYYAHMIEFGHRIFDFHGKDTGRRYPAMGYMTKAFNMNLEKNKNELFHSIINELEKRWKRIPSKTRPNINFGKLK
jgi:hypothetical protein